MFVKNSSMVLRLECDSVLFFKPWKFYTILSFNIINNYNSQIFIKNYTMQVKKNNKVV